MPLDVLPKLIVELRDDAGVDAIVDGRVRGAEPAPPVIKAGVIVSPGDAQPKGSYRAFVVLTRLDSPRLSRAPVQFTQIGATAYGRTRAEAYALYAACSDAIQDLGTRVHANGLGIYISKDTGGPTQDTDPDTSQPCERFFISAIAATIPVGLGS